MIRELSLHCSCLHKRASMHDAEMKADNALTMWTNSSCKCSDNCLSSGKKMTPNWCSYRRISVILLLLLLFFCEREFSYCFCKLYDRRIINILSVWPWTYCNECGGIKVISSAWWKLWYSYSRNRWGGRGLLVTILKHFPPWPSWRFRGNRWIQQGATSYFWVRGSVCNRKRSSFTTNCKGTHIHSCSSSRWMCFVWPWVHDTDSGK